MLQLWWRWVKLWDIWLNAEDPETVQATTADRQACWVYIWAEIRWQCLSHVSTVWKSAVWQFGEPRMPLVFRRRWPSPAAGLLFPFSSVATAERNWIWVSDRGPPLQRVIPLKTKCVFWKHTLNHREVLMLENTRNNVQNNKCLADWHIFTSRCHIPWGCYFYVCFR